MPFSKVAVRMSERAKVMIQLLGSLRKDIEEVRNKVYQQEENRLKAENQQLKDEVEKWKSRLVEAELKNGIRQVSLPASKSKNVLEDLNKEPSICVTQTDVAPPNNAKVTEEHVKEKGNTVKKEKKSGKPKKELSGGDDEMKPIDVSRLDFRIGIIQSAKKHPDADSLYVEQVDVGEERPRTVVSGLVKYVPLEEMQNRLVVLLCNLKPAKMRGVLSEAMVMCASSPEKVEILVPPSSCVPGERIIFEGFPGEPDAQLNPKKKIFEQLAPDIKTDDNCIATYKGVPFTVKDKGVVKSVSMANVNIK